MKMRTPILNQLNDLSPWLITRAGLRELVDIPEARMAVEFEDFFQLRPESHITPDGIATIYIHQALTAPAPAIYSKLGMVTEYETITAEIEAAETQGAEAFLFVTDSPGGSVLGCYEAAQAIAGIGAPTAAFCSGKACSAAYWLMSGCDQIVATQSATVGNIGAVIAYVDDSKFWEGLGVEFRAITNEGADLKGTFYEGRLSDSQMEFLQASVNESGKAFRSHVESFRDVDEEVFRAGWYSGQRAVELGLVDAIGSESMARQYLLDRI